MNNIYKDKKVLIFGLGLNQGGVGSAKFFASHGAKVRVTDLKNSEILKPSLDQLKQFPDIKYTLGGHKNEDIDWADLIIKNPAIKPGNPYIAYAHKIGKQVEMDMGIFLQFVNPSQIIGVTGTKGKSTTASLIYEVLKTIKENVIFAGNIGKSVLDTIPYINKDTLVVLELSSFQLESFTAHKVSPKWAVITNITPDHLNYYKTMEEYTQAKRIIAKYQTESDFLFLRKNDPITTNPNFSKRLKGKIIYFSKYDLPKDFRPILKGEHNLENIAAALTTIKQIKQIPNLNLASQGDSLRVLENFNGVEFRMQVIKEWDGIKIINDTTATGPDAGIQAIKTASHSSSGNVVLICGGMNKGLDYRKYAAVLSKNVKNVFLLEGDATDAILLSLRASLPRVYPRGSNLPIYGPYNNLEKLLTDVKASVKPGDAILFSPAATSFNLFQNEFDRGERFNKAVEKVFGEDIS